MRIFDRNDNVEAHGFSFWVDLVDPLIIVENIMRSEAEYSSEENPHLFPLRILRRIRDACPFHLYLALSEGGISPVRKLKTYKGLLWGNEVLRAQDHREFEVAVAGKNLSRLGGVVSLDNFDFVVYENLLFHLVNSCIVLSSMAIDPMAEKVRQWLELDRKKLFGFDYARIAADLPACDSTSILRYFPADRGRPEFFALLSTKNTFEGIRRHWLRIFEPKPKLVV